MAMSLFKHKLHAHKPKNINQAHDESMTFGDKIADKVANFVGSWKFVISQSAILCIWMILNILSFTYHYDPYPFIAMNLLLSAQAAYATPLIMMSQNRQSSRDRLAAEEDYNINRKGEHEIEQMIEHLCEQDKQIIQANEELLRQTAMLVRLLQDKQSQ